MATDKNLAFFFFLGTTWMREIVPLFLTGGDPASVETLPNWDRAPWLEQERARLLNLQESPTPRILTTHFSFDAMPPFLLKVKPTIDLLFI